MEFPKRRMKPWVERSLLTLLGASLGYAYYYYVGCVTGTCPITSNPWTSTVIGAIVGVTIIPWKV
jgi:hypothetical protein